MVATRKHSKPYPPPPETPSSATGRSTSTSRRGVVRRSSKPPSSSAADDKPRRTLSQSQSQSQSRSRSRSRPRSSSTAGAAAATQTPSYSGTWTHRPSPLIMLWLLISIPLVLWDTGYVFLRPYSMPGGPLHFLWKPYGLYGQVDFMYGWPEYRAGNGFVGAQSAINLVEVMGYVYYLVTVFKCSEVREKTAKGGRKIQGKGEGQGCWLFTSRNSLGGREGVIALLVIFACSVMTVSKTVLYGLVEAFSGFRDVGHNGPARLVLLWLIPNGLWVVFPSYAAYYFASEILNALQTVTGVPAREKTRRIKSL